MNAQRFEQVFHGTLSYSLIGKLKCVPADLLYLLEQGLFAGTEVCVTSNTCIRAVRRQECTELCFTLNAQLFEQFFFTTCFDIRLIPQSRVYP